MPVTNDDDLREIIQQSHRIAVVGLSSNPLRPSNGVALFLKANGFDIVPVNPNETVVNGADAVADLGRSTAMWTSSMCFGGPNIASISRGRRSRSAPVRSGCNRAFAMTRRWRLPRRAA